MVNLPFQLPTQIGQDDAFDRVVQAPPIIRYTTMISGEFDASKVSDATNLLLASSAGTIFQFWNAQQQNADISALPQVGGGMKLPAMDLRYTRNQGTSQLDVTLYPEAIANLEEALEYQAETHTQGQLPLQIQWGQSVKISVQFSDWGLDYGEPKTYPAASWASAFAVGPTKTYAGKDKLKGKQYFELHVQSLPRGNVPPNDVETLGGTDDGNYTDSPIQHHTGAQNIWKWPAGLDTFLTPNVGIVTRDKLNELKSGAVKNPYDNLILGITGGTKGGVALSTVVGNVRTHTRTETTTYPDSGYKIFNDDTSETFWADYFIAGPDVSDTTDRTWTENEIIGNGGYLFQVAFGSSGTAPKSGPPTSYATPGYPSQFTWNGLTWFYIGGVDDGLFTLTTIGWISTGRPTSGGDYSNFFLSVPVDGSNYTVGTPPSDGNIWAPAPAIAPDGYVMNYTDPSHGYVGGYHQSFTGVCANHITYTPPGSPVTVVTENDTYSANHKYGDIFSGVPGAVAFDDGSTLSEIPPGHGPGHTFPIMQIGQWEEGGTSLDPIQNDDVIMVAVDLDKGKMWFGKNGSWRGNPADGAGEALFFPPDNTVDWHPAAGGFGPFKGTLRLGVGLKHSPPKGFTAAGLDTISFDIPYDIS